MANASTCLQGGKLGPLGLVDAELVTELGELVAVLATETV